MINEANVICKMFTKVYNKLVEIYGENNFNVSLYLMYLFNVFTKQFFFSFGQSFIGDNGQDDNNKLVYFYFSHLKVIVVIYV